MLDHIINDPILKQIAYTAKPIKLLDFYLR